jgi:CBS domain-containing protein
LYAVQDWMTREVLTLSPMDELGKARDVFATAGIRHLPVLEDGKLVGLLSQRDYLRASANLPGAASLGIPVGQVMTRKVRTVRPGTPLRRAARVMLGRKLGCLPVLDADGTLVGILTEADLAALAEELITELDRVTVPLQQLQSPPG